MILLTGFEPFGGQEINASALAVCELDARRIGGHEVKSVVLPCTFAGSLIKLDEELVNEPVLVVCVGQAGGREGIHLERVAFNLDDARIPDNAGQKPARQRIEEHGLEQYRSTLPVDSIATALRGAGMTATLSDSAGRFVCNHIFYGLMSRLASTPSVLGGFVHVPFLQAQAQSTSAPSMALEQIALALEITIDHSLSSSATG